MTPLLWMPIYYRSDFWWGFLAGAAITPTLLVIGLAIWMMILSGGKS